MTASVKRTERIRLIIGAVLGAAAIALIVVGAMRTREVMEFDEIAAEAEIFIPETISEKDLVIDATFSGVVRRNGMLLSTYDRSQPRGKQACPT